jgi:hypothetical protein
MSNGHLGKNAGVNFIRTFSRMFCKYKIEHYEYWNLKFIKSRHLGFVKQWKQPKDLKDLKHNIDHLQYPLDWQWPPPGGNWSQAPHRPSWRSACPWALTAVCLEQESCLVSFQNKFLTTLPVLVLGLPFTGTLLGQVFRNPSVFEVFSEQLPFFHLCSAHLF